MTTYTATYSPDDNKLRLYASTRLDAETYAKAKALGFKWAPKQDLFFAPAWTPEREDFLTELAGEIEDEDKSLVDRAEERAERFEEYRDKRASDAERAREGVAQIAEGIPLGQPILVGHHSERHARKDAERIQNGMRKAVKMWETSKYWQSRAAGALAHAKYKELPGVRHRRIKTIEADRRKVERAIEEAATKLKLWSKEGLTLEEARKIANFANPGVCRRENPGQSYASYWNAWDVLRPDGERYEACPAWTVEQVQEAAKRAYTSGEERRNRWLAHYDNRLAYERAMLAEQGGTIADRFAIVVGGKVLVGNEWLTVLRVNRSGGAISSVTTNARYVQVLGIERVKDYRPPEEGDVATVKAALKPPPICNYPGEGFREMTEAEWNNRRKWSDFPYLGRREATETAAAHRVRQMPKPGGGMWEKQTVFLTDAKRKDPPKPGAVKVKIPKAAPADLPAPAPRVRQEDPRDAEFAALKQAAKTGVQVVAAPQLFPTPPELAARMVEAAAIEAGHRVLEPSAGTGNLLREIYKEAPAHVVAVEINPSLAGRLEVMNSAIVCGDFLQCTAESLWGRFDRIVMNPPFAGGADVDHVRHAFGMLKPGGRLVAVMSSGTTFRSDRKTTDFRRFLEEHGAEIEELAPDTFKASGTGVNTILVTIDAPRASAEIPADLFAAAER